MIDLTPGLKWRANSTGTDNILRIIDPWMDNSYFILTLNHRGIGDLTYSNPENAIRYARNEYNAESEVLYPVTV